MTMSYIVTNDRSDGLDSDCRKGISGRQTCLEQLVLEVDPLWMPRISSGVRLIGNAYSKDALENLLK